MCVLAFVVTYTSCTHDILTSALSKKLLRMLTRSSDICKLTHDVFLSIFDGDEGMAQIRDKAAAHAGLTHSVDEIEEKETRSEIPSLDVASTN